MPDDFTSGIDTTGRVAVGGTAAGELEAAHDRDWFAVELVAGRTYTIDLRGRPTEDGTLSDPYLRGIHDADGNLVPGTTNDDWGGTYNSRVTFTASESGTYYIAAGAFSNRQGTYEVEVMDNSPPAPEPPATPLQPTTGQTVPEPAGADLAADPSTTGRVAVGETATGNIESAGDRDWFAVELVAGRTYTIDLRGRPTADGTLSDPYLRGIHDAQGNLLSGTTNDDWGGTYNSRVTFTASESGTHYIAAGAFSSRQGTYELAVTDNSPSAPAPEPPAASLGETPPQTGSEPAGADLAAGLSTTGRVAVGETATGNIESAGDRDWFAVELVAGRAYTIDLRGRPTGDGTLSDPYLRGIHDAQGNLLSGTRNDDWGGTYNSRVTFTATETGTHYIAAGAYSSRQGTYEVEVTDNSPAPVEEPPSVRVSDAEATEGDDAEIVFHVTLDRAASGPVTVRYATADGTAVAGEDYEAASGTLTFAPGETERTVRVRVLDDAVEDSGETFRLVLSAPGGATLADPEALGTILNTEPVSEPPNGDLPAGLPHGPSTPGRVVVGDDPVTGEIEYDPDYVSDRDWFAVELEGSTHYRIDLEGSETLHGRISAIYRVQDGLLTAVRTTREVETGTGEITAGEDGDAAVWFRAPESGTYYIDVRAREGRRNPEDGDTRSSGPANFGDYRLAVVELPATVREITETIGEVLPTRGDFPADDSTPGQLLVDGGRALGNIPSLGDRDWYAVNLEGGTTYRIEVIDTSFPSLLPKQVHAIFNAFGEQVPYIVQTHQQGGVDARVWFEAPADGTYYLDLGAMGPTEGLFNGSYQLLVTETDDIPGSLHSEATVDVGGSVAGDLEFERDSDWFRVTLEAGQTYRIDLEGASTGRGTNPNPILDGIYNSDGRQIPDTRDHVHGEGANARLFFTPDADGTYWIATSGGAYHEITETTDAEIPGVSVPTEVELHHRTGTYTLSVTDVTATETPASTATTRTVDVGGYATGEVQAPNDENWYRVTLEAGKTYRIDVEGERHGGPDFGTLFNPQIRGIYDADGNRLADTQDSYSGSAPYNAQVIFSPTADGTYYIGAGSADDTGTYRVTVADITDDDEPARPHTVDDVTAPVIDLSGDGTAEGEIHGRHDRDWFQVVLQGGTTYRIEMQGSETSRGTLSDPFIRGVHDADGRYLPGTSNDDVTLNGWWRSNNSEVSFTPTEDGTYYVVASSAHTGYGSNGTYEVSVEVL